MAIRRACMVLFGKHKHALSTHLSRSQEDLGFYPTCKLTHGLTPCHGGWHEMQDSWVRGKGLCYSQQSRNRSMSIWCGIGAGPPIPTVKMQRTDVSHVHIIACIRKTLILGNPLKRVQRKSLIMASRHACSASLWLGGTIFPG